jgi:hypothetical protein
MDSYRKKVWSSHNSLDNVNKKDSVVSKLEYWGISSKVIFFNGNSALMVTINNKQYTIEVDNENMCLKVLAKNTFGNKSGHRQHYVKDKSTGKPLQFKGNICWDELISWLKRIKQKQLKKY